MKLEMASPPGFDSSAKTNYFFKFILSNATFQTKLMIPRKFVRKYGKDLDSPISLEAPNGLTWHVKLARQKDEIWLQDGWPEFTRFYSLQFGHLLVFKFRGRCDFKVRIFDPSCTEIDYPLSTSAKLNMRELSQVKKRAIEIDRSTCSDLIRPPKKRMKKLALKDASHINGLCLMPKLQQEKAKLGAPVLAEAFRSKNPFFSRAMRISHVDGKFRGLVVKKAFEEKYRSWKHNDKVRLQVAGKTWLVNCDMKWNRCRLSSGWDRFAKDNSLTLGDVCVFELIDACTKLLEVIIFRATKERNGSDDSTNSYVVKVCKKRTVTSLCLKSFRETPILQQEKVNVDRELASEVEKVAYAKALKSENPTFILTTKPYFACGGGGRPFVPKAFREAYEKWKHDDQIILQVAGRSSPFYCTLKWNDLRCGFRISPGWGVFARDNTLNVGDVCVFELIVPSNKLFQVSIFRASDEAEKTVIS